MEENRHTNPWYSTREGQQFLLATDYGKFIFVWEAIYEDGKPVRQFDEFAFQRALSDPTFVPPDATRLSIDMLDKERIVEFRLHPIAYARAFMPCFQKPIIVKLDPKKGERLVSNWLVDEVPTLHWKLYRTVVGVQRGNDGEPPTLVVISPSGSVMICRDTNQNFEGE